jgi:hypothetical protein
MPPQRAYGRVFYFGRKQEELRHRAMECALIGNIEPEWDDLVGAEIEFGDNAQRHSKRDLSGN